MPASRYPESSLHSKSLFVLRTVALTSLISTSISPLLFDSPVAVIRHPLNMDLLGCLLGAVTLTSPPPSLTTFERPIQAVEDLQGPWLQMSLGLWVFDRLSTNISIGMCSSSTAPVARA